MISTFNILAQQALIFVEQIIGPQFKYLVRELDKIRLMIDKAVFPRYSKHNIEHSCNILEINIFEFYDSVTKDPFNQLQQSSYPLMNNFKVINIKV